MLRKYKLRLGILALLLSTFIGGALYSANREVKPTIQSIVMLTQQERDMSYHRPVGKFLITPGRIGALVMELWLEYYEIGELKEVTYQTTREFEVSRRNEQVPLWISSERFAYLDNHFHVKLGGHPEFQVDPEFIVRWKEFLDFTHRMTILRDAIPFELDTNYNLEIWWNVSSVQHERHVSVIDHMMEHGEQIYILKAKFSFKE